MVVRETDRPTLRMLRELDLDAYAEMCANPEVTRYIGDGQLPARAMAWRNLALMVGHWSLQGTACGPSRSDPSYACRADRLLESGRLAGLRARLDAAPVLLGCGYATEASRAAPQLVFTQMQQPRVISLSDPENAASIRVAQRPHRVMGTPALVYAISREK